MSSRPDSRSTGDLPQVEVSMSFSEGKGGHAFQGPKPSADEPTRAVATEKGEGDNRPRLPRYNTHTSYVEMLDNMADGDPFNGEAPPPKTPKPSSARQTDRKPQNSIAMSAVSSAKRKRTNRRSIVAQNSASHAHNKMQAPESQKLTDNRKSSVSSSNTYVVGRNDLSPLIGETPTKSAVVESVTGAPAEKDNNASGTLENCLRIYIKENIQHRECSHYIRNTDKEGFCQCGRSDAWHEDNNVASSSDDKWSSEKHSKSISSDSYGYISPQGFGYDISRLIPYIRVDHKTDMEVLWKVLSQFWGMDPPKLIVSVTGGAKRFFMKNRLKDNFNRGLINAATTTGAWIITGGTKTGVMEFVGEAVRDYTLATGSSEQKVVAIGIATWGAIDNKESLISRDGNGCFPATYSMDKLTTGSVRGVAALDHNHTHFIFVDNGTDHKFGAEISFRAELEYFISNRMTTGVDKNYSVHVPVVLLVLEGGENTLQQAVEAIDNKTPVVVVQGSGRAADFIALAYKNSRSQDGDDESVLLNNFEEDMTANANKMFDWSREKNEDRKNKKVKNCVESVKKCLKKRSLITVYQLDDIDTTNEIDRAILNALLKANKSDAQCQLSLALAWNRCDVARQEIFRIDTRSEWKKMDLYGAMVTALAQDRVDFVQLFLDNGVNLKRFLTVERLHELYETVLEDQNITSGAELLKHLIQQTNQWRSRLCCGDRSIIDEEELPRLLSIVGEIIQNLTGDHQNNFYGNDRFIVKNKSEADKLGLNNPGFNTIRAIDTNSDFEHPERELFLFAVLLNRRDLASLFWRIGRDHIGCALMGSALLTSLGKKANSEEEIDLSQDLVKHADEFEERAVGILGQCYQRDKGLSHHLLIRELPLWGGTTLMAIANSAEKMDFMGHSSCQTKLNQIWKGQMALYTSFWKIMVSMVFPFTLFTIKFTTREMDSNSREKQNSQYFSKGVSNQIEPDDVCRPQLQSSGGAGGAGDKGAQFVQSASRQHISPLTQKLFSVGFAPDCIKPWVAVYHYYTAPVSKFWFHTLFYILFLGLFSYILLTKLHPNTGFIKITYQEIALWIWATTLFFEEIRQIQANEARTTLYKIKGYATNVWNRFDFTIHVMFIIAVLLRCAMEGERFTWARMFYAITLCLYFVRFMHTFFVQKNIGPKVIMISKMLTDLLFFMCILVVVILAYGVASQALRYPSSNPSWKLLKDIVYLPYWQMYGELFLDNVEGGSDGSCSTNETALALNSSVERCAEKSWLAIVLFAIYMIMTNVLLLNLLIAMFSYTFEKVQDNSEKVWRFYRYDLIYEYFDRPTLAPPLIVFSHVFRLIKFCMKTCRQNEKISHYFRQVISIDEQKKLTAFEKVGLEEYLIHRTKQEREHIDVKVSSAGERIEKVIGDLEQIKDHVLFKEDTTDVVVADTSQQAPVKTDTKKRYEVKEDINILQSRVTGLETQMNKLHEQQKGMTSMLSKLLTATAGGDGGGRGNHGNQGVGRGGKTPRGYATQEDTSV